MKNKTITKGIVLLIILIIIGIYLNKEFNKEENSKDNSVNGMQKFNENKVEVDLENSINSENVFIIEDEKKNENFILNYNQFIVELYMNSNKNYLFKNVFMRKDEAILLKDGNSGVTLEKDSLVSIEFKFNLDSPKNFIVGYILDEQFTEIHTDLSSREINASFKPPQNGEYTICIIGEDTDIRIEEGIISIK